jgi:hypothetical protein
MAKHTKPIKESVWAYCRRNRLESVLMQWHPVRNRGVTPDEVPAGSHRHVWWMCKQGHEWQAEVRCRTLYGNGCPFCANRAVLPGFNDLATLYPELAAEWHPTKNGALTPEQVLAGSEKRVWWQCGRGHAWQTSVSTRTRANCRCPVCAGRTVLAGENDLATLSPELAAEWHPTLNGALTPDMVTAGSNKRVWWQCRLGHVWVGVPLLYKSQGAGGLQRSDDSASGAGQAVASHAERGPDAGYGNAGDAKTSLVDLSRGTCVELRHLQPDGGEAAQRLSGMRGQCKGKPTV